MDHVQFPPGDMLKSLKFPNEFSLVEIFRVPIGKTPDHREIPPGFESIELILV